MNACPRCGSTQIQALSAWQTQCLSCQHLFAPPSAQAASPYGPPPGVPAPHPSSPQASPPSPYGPPAGAPGGSPFAPQGFHGAAPGAPAPGGGAYPGAPSPHYPGNPGSPQQGAYPQGPGAQPAAFGAMNAPYPPGPAGQPAVFGAGPGFGGPNPPFGGPVGGYPANVAPGPGMGTGVKVFLILGALFLLLLIGGGVAMAAFVRSKAKAIATASGTSTVATTRGTGGYKAPAKVSLDVVSTKFAQNQYSTIWISNVKNSGATPLSNVKVTVSLFDAADHRVGEFNGYSYRHQLPAGEAFPIQIFGDKVPSFSRTEVIAQGDPVSPYSLPEIEIKVKESSRTGNAYSKKIVGTVQNTSNDTLQFVRVVAIGKNAAGEPVSIAEGFASIKEMPASTDSGFSIIEPFLKAETPATYSLVAFGNAKKI